MRKTRLELVCPLPGTRLSTWRVCRFHHFRPNSKRQSPLGVPTPASAGTNGGCAPTQEARTARADIDGPRGRGVRSWQRVQHRWCGRWDSNPHARRRAPAPEAGVSAGIPPLPLDLQRPEPPRGADPRLRRYKGRGPAGAGGVVPTEGLAPSCPKAPRFGLGVYAFHHVGSGGRERSWTRSDSNRSPAACKAAALPDELRARGRSTGSRTQVLLLMRELHHHAVLCCGVALEGRDGVTDGYRPR